MYVVISSKIMPNSYVLKKKKSNIKSDQKRAKFFVMEFVRVCYKFIHAAKKYSLDYSILVFIVQIGILFLFFCCDSIIKSALEKMHQLMCPVTCFTYH